ncbi:hypothetical protein FZC66_05385 [Priestia megaterium]|nr:hypothetical protein FZC66_05385 [Priestia megaterium]
MARVLLGDEQGTNFEKALSYIPHVKKLYDELYETLWNSQQLDQITKEKIRVYLASVNGCETCLSMSYVSGGEVNQMILEKKSTLSSKDVQLFSFIKAYREAPRTLTDEDFVEMKKTYTDVQLMELLAVINLFDGFHKMIVSLDLYDFCRMKTE